MAGMLGGLKGEQQRARPSRPVICTAEKGSDQKWLGTITRGAWRNAIDSRLDDNWSPASRLQQEIMAVKGNVD